MRQMTARKTRSATRRAGTAGPARRRTQSGARHAVRRQGNGRARGSARPAQRFFGWLQELADGGGRVMPFFWAAGALILSAALYGFVIGGGVQSITAFAASKLGAASVVMGFSVEEITLKGRKATESEEIMQALGIVRGTPILAFDTQAARERLERLDWVRSASVSRLLPDTIHVEVTERRPQAIWQRGGRLSLIDLEGRPFSDDIDAFAHLPLVVGHGAARAARDLLTALSEHPDMNQRVRSAIRVADRRWNLRFDNGVDVKLPRGSVERSLASLAALERDERVLARDVTVIDMRLADRITFELSPDAAQRREAESLAGAERADRKEGDA